VAPQSVCASRASSASSCLARAAASRSQKMQELQAIDEMTARIQPIAQIKPEVLDFINFDKIVQEFGDLLGVDPELMNDEAEVKKIRYKRQKEQQPANDASSLAL
jgi:hypothetical protein